MSGSETREQKLEITIFFLIGSVFLSSDGNWDIGKLRGGIIQSFIPLNPSFFRKYKDDILYSLL
jgi:hypothetical protein